MTTTQRRLRVMGTDAHVVVVGAGDALAERAEARLRILEMRWSRFSPDSELNRLHGVDGAPCVVSHDLAVLVEAMRTGWLATGGRFDPSVHDAMVGLGYDRTFADIGDPVGAYEPAPAPGCAGIDVDPASGYVRLRAGLRLDPGGVGKGLAADLVTGDLLRWGASGALVNIGGDLRVRGASPDGSGAWRVAVECPDDAGRDLAFVDLADGGVATTTSRRRRWRARDGGEAHHLVDPRTGDRAGEARLAATAVAASAWWAEVVAKVAFLDGALPDACSSALLVGAGCDLATLGDPSWFALPAQAAR